jgi:hypothetical protein
MAYWLLENDRATYAVDWDVVYRLIRGYHRAVKRDEYTTVSTASESRWYNPLSWSLPEIQSLDVDWDKVRSTSLANADRDFARLAEVATRDVREMHRELKWMVAQTARRTNAYVDRQGAIQSDNMSRIGKAVDSYGKQTELAKFVRDTSADGLMVGASIASSGAGLAVLGGGSALKGWAKFQDTDNPGAAVATGVGSFMFGAFKLGGTELMKGEEAVITIMQAKWEGSVALVEGRSLGEAAALGSLKLAGPFVDRIFKSDAAKRILDWACVPISITVVGPKGVQNNASKFAGSLVSKVAQKQGVERGGKAAIKALSGQVASGSQVRQSRVLETATLGDDALLTFAIVNMSTGIGRGL